VELRLRLNQVQQDAGLVQFVQRRLVCAVEAASTRLRRAAPPARVARAPARGARGLRVARSRALGRAASAELRASGETARKRDPSTIDQLTAKELQIARLVGEGMSSKEVAAQLFLSPRTIDYHLRKVFTKLAITSRTELVRLGLAEEQAAAVS
jgi:DNA-binding CsgD family transcriptional regulator